MIGEAHIQVGLLDSASGQMVVLNLGAVPIPDDAPPTAVAVAIALRTMADRIETRKTFQAIVNDLGGLS